MSDEPEVPEVPDVRARSAFGPAADLPPEPDLRQQIAELMLAASGIRPTYRHRIDARHTAGVPTVTSHR